MSMMSLRDKLGVASSPSESRQKRLYERYGVLDNPFPPSHKTAGNPRQPLAADEEIGDRVKRFLENGNSEVIVVTGTQGLGKTNLLEYYQRELPPILQERGNFYVVRYYTDLEPDFGAVVRLIFQELGIEHLQTITRKASQLSQERQKDALNLIQSRELREAFKTLFEHQSNDLKLMELSKLLLDYLMGLRIYKRHEELGLQHRLSTTESKTKALHDIIYLSHNVKALDGLFLFLDELEKLGGMPIRVTTSYLSAIRALIDALPEHIFLILAMTPEARLRYIRDLPALGGRLQDKIDLNPLKTSDEAFELYNFYLESKRDEASKDTLTESWLSGNQMPLTRERIDGLFNALLQEDLKIGIEGVTQRKFLDRLHENTERQFNISVQ